jgi:ethanolamine utilization microcompartment shell protein EutL
MRKNLLEKFVKVFITNLKIEILKFSRLLTPLDTAVRFCALLRIVAQNIHDIRTRSKALARIVHAGTNTAYISGASRQTTVHTHLQFRPNWTCSFELGTAVVTTTGAATLLISACSAETNLCSRLAHIIRISVAYEVRRTGSLLRTAFSVRAWDTVTVLIAVLLGAFRTHDVRTLISAAVFIVAS